MLVTEADPLLTVEQVAERLQLNPETIRRYLRRGLLHGILLGRAAGYRVRESELARFLREREQTEEPTP